MQVDRSSTSYLCLNPFTINIIIIFFVSSVTGNEGTAITLSSGEGAGVSADAEASTSGKIKPLLVKEILHFI